MYNRSVFVPTNTVTTLTRRCLFRWSIMYNNKQSYE